jgi:drug/metabolite transporter (DMT)-like permease
MKQANQFFSPVTFVTSRFILGAAVLLALNYLMKIPIPKRRYWKWIVLSGILQIAVNNAAVQMGMHFLGAGFAAVLNYSMPLWVAIMAHFFLGEKLTKRKVVGIVLSMMGLVALLNVSSNDSWEAIFLTLIGAASWAASSIIIKLKLQDCNMLQYTTWQMVAGSIVLIMYTAVFEQVRIQWGWLAVGCLLYNGVLASALAFFLWSYVLAHMEAGKASISVLAVPIIGVLAGMILLNEPMYWNTAMGMALILSGILFVITQKKLDKEPAQYSN